MSVRKATRTDLSFIKDSWLRSYERSYHVKRVSPQVYRHHHGEVADKCLSRGKVLVACDTRDPWIVWGWCCYEWDENVLVWHYSYTKEPFRGYDVATHLFRQAVAERCPSAVVYTHDTRASRKFAEGLVSSGSLTVPYIYNPYLLYIT